MSESLTREQLEQALSSPQDDRHCLRLLAAVPPAERRKLAPIALAWYRALHALRMGRETRGKIPLPPPYKLSGFFKHAVVAVIATASGSEVRRLPEWKSPDSWVSHDVLFEAYSTFAPDWFDEWAEAYISIDPTNWVLIRRLNRAGIGTRSDSDAFISGMLAGIDLHAIKDRRGIRERLLEDPELLDHEIWRLFEVQRPNSLNFAARDESRQTSGTRWLPYLPADDRAHQLDPTVASTASETAATDPLFQGWLEVFVQFANEGRLSRTRMLEASLAAIERDFPDAFSRWFPKLHEALQPTSAERQQFLPRYWNYLRSKNGSTVTFALDVIQKLDASGQLPADDAIHHLPAVLIDKTKARAKLALRLLEQITKRNPGQATRVANCVSPALNHSATDVQQSAWRLIERFGDNTDVALRQSVTSAVDSVAPSLRASLFQWLNTQSTPDIAAVETAPASSGIEPLVHCARSLPESFARIARIPELLQEIESQGDQLPIVDLCNQNFPCLAHPVTPLSSVDDLIDACAIALETLDSPDEIERLLDGISRLCDQRPEGFDRLTGPLKKRTLAKLKGSDAAVFQGDNIVADTYAVIWAWLTGEVCSQTIVQHNVQNLQASLAGGEAWVAFPPEDPNWLRDAFSQRAISIATRVSQQNALLLLSAPTHAGGWIDPMALVQRVALLGDKLSEVSEFDQALSLLRLAPDHRADALKHLAAMPPQVTETEYCRALCHALGAKAVAIGSNASLWCAAARARATWEDDPAVNQHHPKCGPNGAQAGQIELTFLPPSGDPGNDPGQFTLTWNPPEFNLPTRHPAPHLPNGKLPPDFQLQAPVPASSNPIWLVHNGLSNFWLSETGPVTVRWGMTVWPANPTPLLARGLFHLQNNIDWKTMLWANRVYLQALLPADVPLVPVAVLVMVVGLAAKEAGESTIAVDVAISAISDGRLNGVQFGEALHGAHTTGLFKLSRWAKSLQEIARATALHADVICETLGRVFTGATASDTRDIALLLELFHELTLDTGREIVAPTQQWLRQFQGTGKAAKAVASLRKAASAKTTRQRTERDRVALQGRIDRVQRWQAICHESESQRAG